MMLIDLLTYLRAKHEWSVKHTLVIRFAATAARRGAGLSGLG